MAMIKHTLMREDISTVNARQFSEERTDLTLQMALEAIGSEYATLLLTDEEDGVWQIDNDVTIPNNVMLQIPLGVTLVGPGDVTVEGGLMALRWPVHLGPGVILWDQATLGPAFSTLTVGTLNVRRLWVSEHIGGGGHFFFGEGPTGGPPPEEPTWRAGEWQHGLSGLCTVDKTGFDYQGFAMNLAAQCTVNSDAWIGAAGSGLRIEANGHTLTGVQVGFGCGVEILGTGQLNNVIGLRTVHMHFGTAIVKQLTGVSVEVADNPGGGIIETYQGVAVYEPGVEIGTINAYAFRGAMGPGTGRYNLYCDGGAMNFLGAPLGIGVQPSATHALIISGSAAKPGGGSWTDSSDRAFKDAITPLTGALSTLLQLQGVTFLYNDAARKALFPGTQMGLIANDVEPVIPAWVGEDDEGYKTLTLRGEFALTIEAMRELEARVAALEDTKRGA